MFEFEVVQYKKPQIFMVINDIVCRYKYGCRTHHHQTI